MRRIALAVFSIALLTAGCGSGDGGQDASTDSGANGTETAAATDTAAESQGNGGSEEGGDGCDLISDELAGSVLGIDIVRREAHGDATTGGVSCIKGTERVTDLTQSFYVSVSVTPGGAAFLDEASSQAGSVAVDGVGDQAVFLPNAGALFIANGTDLVQTQVVLAGVPAGQEECVTVAEHVLDNL